MTILSSAYLMKGYLQVLSCLPAMLFASSYFAGHRMIKESRRIFASLTDSKPHLIHETHRESSHWATHLAQSRYIDRGDDDIRGCNCPPFFDSVNTKVTDTTAPTFLPGWKAAVLPIRTYTQGAVQGKLCLSEVLSASGLIQACTVSHSS